MKFFFLATTLLILAFNAQAEKIESQIHSIDLGKNGEQHLVMLKNGRVAFVEILDKTLMKRLEKSLKKKDWLELILDKNYNLQSVQNIPAQFSHEDYAGYSRRDLGEPYKPSVVSMNDAKVLFSKMRKDYQNESQCFNRAHIWTYNAFINNQIYSNKVFLFFTSRYIRSHRFHWWFHVTPMMFIDAVGRANWKILDRRYTSGPINSKTWTDIFIKTKKTCKTVYKYSDYRDHQQSEDCYMIPVSMYFVVPSDIERLESTGEERVEYDADEVDYALWEAF